MFEIIYSIFFLVLIIQVIAFMFLTLPTPKGWKGKVVNFLNTNSSVQYIRKIHLGFTIIAGMFLWDSISNSNKFQQNKAQAKAGDSIAAEMKGNYYSYLNLKAQRNIYITAMLIYVSLSLNIYVAILNYMYTKRSKYQAQQKIIQQQKLQQKKVIQEKKEEKKVEIKDRFAQETPKV